MALSYSVQPIHDANTMQGGRTSNFWQAAEEVRIENFHPASSDYRPDSRVRMLHDGRNLFLSFRVADQYVLARQSGYQAPVWRDSCVECFLQPPGKSEYFNFEINCGGSLLLYYVEDPTRTEHGLARFTPVAEEHYAKVAIAHSLPELVDPEISEPVVWDISCHIPIEVLEAYVGRLGAIEGQTWRGNFYKCAEDNSHPHWAAWSPIGAELNFHQPQCFAPLIFCR